MKLRILTALVLIPPVLYLLGWAPGWLYALAVIAVAERALYEYFVMVGNGGVGLLPAMGYAACMLFCLLQAIALRHPGSSLELVFAGLMVVLLATLLVALAVANDLKTYLPAVATTLFGVVYIGATFSCLVPLRFSSSTATEGRYWVLLLFGAVWAGDAGAYFTGQLLGRTPLAPRISPNKTVEGSIGGFAASLLTAWLFRALLWKTADLERVMLLVGLVAIAGQAGDLVESALKRGAALKDSGELLPGHGGMLDRIDSLLFAAPALWLALALEGLLKSR